MFYDSLCNAIYHACATHFTCNPTRNRHKKGGIWPLLKSAAVCFVGHSRASTVQLLRKTE